MGSLDSTIEVSLLEENMWTRAASMLSMLLHVVACFGFVACCRVGVQMPPKEYP